MISKHIKQELDRWHATHDRLSADYARAQTQYLDCYKRIAEILLQEVPDRIPHQATQAALQARRAKQQELVDKQLDYVEQYEKQLAERALLEEQLQQLLTVLDQRLSESSYAELEEKLQEIWSRYEAECADWEKNNELIVSLLDTFKKDKIYSYLKKRFALHPKRISWIDFQTRLECWLAEKTSYASNRSTEELLLRYYSRGKARVKKITEQLSHAELQCDEALLALEKEIGITSLRDARSQCNEAIKGMEERLLAIRSSLDEITANIDSDFWEIHRLLHINLQLLPPSVVRSVVEASPSREDDELLHTLSSLDDGLREIQAALRTAQNMVEKLSREYNDAVARDNEERRRREAEERELRVRLVEGFALGLMRQLGSSVSSRSSSGWGHVSSGESIRSDHGGGTSAPGSFGGGGFRTTDQF